MKVKLNQDKIIKNLYTEKELTDLSITESIYVIRKLKALSYSLKNGFIETLKQNENNQVFSEGYQIWFSKDEYEIL